MSGHKCGGMHCDGCNRGPGSKGLAAGVALVLVLLLALGHALMSGAAHGVAAGAEILVIVVIVAAGLAVMAGLAVVAVRLRRRAHDRAVWAPVRVVSVGPGRPGLPGQTASPFAVSSGPGKEVLGLDSAGRPVYAIPGCGDSPASIGTDAHLAIGADAHRDMAAGFAWPRRARRARRPRRPGRWS